VVERAKIKVLSLQGISLREIGKENSAIKGPSLSDNRYFELKSLEKVAFSDRICL
jgi:hypothetical protein